MNYVIDTDTSLQKKISDNLCHCYTAFIHKTHNNHRIYEWICAYIKVHHGCQYVALRQKVKITSEIPVIVFTLLLMEFKLAIEKSKASQSSQILNECSVLSFLFHVFIRLVHLIIFKKMYYSLLFWLHPILIIMSKYETETENMYSP